MCSIRSKNCQQGMYWFRGYTGLWDVKIDIGMYVLMIKRVLVHVFLMEPMGIYVSSCEELRPGTKQVPGLLCLEGLG